MVTAAAAMLGAAALAAAAPTPAARYEPVVVRLAHPARVAVPLPTRPAARPAAVERQLRASLARGGGPLRDALARLERDGEVRRVRPLWIAGGYAVLARPAAVAALRRRADVALVQRDSGTAAAPAAAEPNLLQIAAPEVWALPSGSRGGGVVVATLDTGVDLSGELAAKWRGGPGSWFDPYGRHPSPVDVAGAFSGHGTETTGLIVGGDAGGSDIGVAPDARFISAKVFDDSGSASTSAIHAAFQWVLDPDGNPDTADAPAVVSNSWVGETPGCNRTFEPDLAALRAAGILPVFAAGNVEVPGSPDESRSPANLPEAFAVGAVDGSGAVWDGSAGGPSSCADDPAFPDVVAPGVGVRSVDRDGVYAGSLTGTSFAAPHVAGVLALLLQAHPGMTADDQARALRESATGGGDPLRAGAGVVSALGAYELPWLPPPRDTTPPVVTLAASGASAPGEVTLHVRADDAAPGARVTGTVASLRYRVDGGPFVALPPLDGAFDSVREDAAATLGGSLSPGTHVIEASATDAAGNASRLVATSVTVAGAPAALSRAIFADGFEQGTLGAWSAHRGALAVTAAARLQGRFGLQLEPGRAPAYVEDDLAPAERSYRATFLLDAADAVTTRAGQDLLVGRSARGAAFRLQLRHLPGGPLELRLAASAAGPWRRVAVSARRLELTWAAGGRCALRVSGRGLAAVASGPASLVAVRLGAPGEGRRRGGVRLDSFASYRG